MNRFLIFFTILLLFVSACNNASEDRGEVIATDSVYVDSSCYVQDTLQLFEEEVLPKSADELFNDFFFNYTSDMNFKNQRQAYSLDCNIGDTIVKIHSSELGVYSELLVDDYYSIIYERDEDLAFQKDTSLNEVAVERIDLEGEQIEQYKFNRIDGKWMLTGIGKNDIGFNPNSDFLDFYKSFSSDSIYRRNRVNEPLKFVLLSEIDDVEDEIQELTSDEWMAISEDLPLPAGVMINIDYGQTIISKNSKLLLVEGVSNGLSLTYRFMKIDGAWNLVEVAL